MSLQENTLKRDEVQLLFEDVIQVQVPNAEPFVYGLNGILMYKLQGEEHVIDIRRRGSTMNLNVFKDGITGCQDINIKLDGSSDPHEEIKKHIKGK